MTDRLISFETAKLAKEKGFVNGSMQDYRPESGLTGIVAPDGVPHLHKNNNMQRFVYEAPTQSLLQKWLREVHSLHVAPDLYAHSDGFLRWQPVCRRTNNTINNCFLNLIIIKKFKDTYEEALEVGLQEALKLINNG
jgi:hypothetical protein